MAIHSMFETIVDGLTALERFASVTTEDGNINQMVGKQHRQAQKAEKAYNREVARLRAKWGEEIKGPNGETGTKVKNDCLELFYRAVELLNKAHVKLAGRALTAEEAEKHFKPSPAEYGQLLGWYITDPNADEEGFEEPDFDELLAEVTRIGEPVRPSLVVPGRVNGAAVMEAE